MCERESITHSSFKALFSVISLLLLLPLIKSGDNSFYITFLIFMMNKFIDLHFKNQQQKASFLKVGFVLAKWFTFFACALAFCSISPSFMKILQIYYIRIDIVLILTASYCVAIEVLTVMLTSVRKDFSESKIADEKEDCD